MTTETTPIHQTVRDEVIRAYADCHDEPPDGATNLEYEAWWNRVKNERNLSFRASQAVSRDEARAILAEAMPNGYNEFKADLLDRFPADCRFIVAREGSVCLYVSGTENTPMPAGTVVLADECDVIIEDPYTRRYWWD